MTELATPDDPEDLWLAADVVDVPQHRMLMQGDLIVVESGPVCIVSHACSMRRGSLLHDTQIVAPIRDHHVSDWKGSYDWMPLTGAQVPGLENPAACLRELRSESTTSLRGGKRIAVMADTGVHLLQQRMACHLIRVIIDVAELAEQSAPVLAEAELHEQWVSDLGEECEPQFHQLLEADNRRLRRWLSEAHTRSQAMRAVREEILRLKELL